MIKGAVVDSGVDFNYFNDHKQIYGGIGYQLSGTQIIECDYKTDVLGHGTSCIDTILQKAPFV